MKKRSRILSVLMSCAMAISAIGPMQVLAAEPKDETPEKEARVVTNIARSAVATSSTTEGSAVGPEKAIDGDSTTRWACNADGANIVDSTPYISLAWAEPQNISSVTIKWERTNVTNYSIQTSTDGTTWTSIKTFTEAPTAYNQEIVLDAAVNTKYLRLQVHEYVPEGAPEGKNSVRWGNMSVYEFEVYADVEDLPFNPSDVIPVYDADTNEITFDVPDGYTVENNGTDYEQVVADDFTVHKPLTDKEVKMALKVKASDGTTTKTGERAVTIPGLHSESTGNAKPQVIPEIAEWYSDSTDHFQLTGDSQIVISSAELNYAGTEFKKDLADITGIDLPVVVGTEAMADAGDFYFTLDSEDTMLGDEGYTMTIGDTVKTEGVNAQGIYWGTRTILQTMKLSEDGISMPEGQMRDYPKYSVRSFIFDVGRKAVSMETLENVAKNMAWYKMNDFQVHLSDNLIFLEDYYNADDPDPMDSYAAYSGYRLESSIANEEGVSIASEDYHYTKAEFKEFMEESRLMGIQIVPEIDVPAHALAITKVFPEYGVNTGWASTAHRALTDHLDIENPEVVEFSKTIFDDYTKGDDPTFDSDTIIHIGADEFMASATAYREYLNTMLLFIKETNPVRLWGGLTWINDNKTEITEEAVQGAQLNLWSCSWADGQDMYNMGFDLINTLDAYGYMVPSGSGSRGSYGDYLNKTTVFNNFEPNKVRKANGTDVYIPAGDKQMLGGAYALWQDNIDTRASGLSEEDLFIRFFDALPLYAEKTWANGKEKGSIEAIDNLVKTISIAPNTNPYNEEESDEGTFAEYRFENNLTEDSSLMNRELTDLTNVTAVTAEGNTALKLAGGTSYAQLPLTKLGSTDQKTLTFTMNLEEVVPGQILFEADSPYGTHDIRITQNGKLGFTRELYVYEFDYTPQANKTVEISIVTGKQQTSLYVDGELTAAATGTFMDGDVAKKSGITNASFALPVQRIGSKTSAVKGTIDNVMIAEAEGLANAIPADNFVITSDNENVLAGGKEGPASLAFDGKTETFWHSNYTPFAPLPATITVDMGKEYKIDKLVYLPRQDGGEGNGIVTKYTISISKTGAEGSYQEVAAGTLADDATEKMIKFNAAEARYVKFTAVEGRHDFASAAEITICAAIEKGELQQTYDGAVEISKGNYTEKTWKAFQEALGEVKKILENDNASQKKVDAAIAKLQSAIGALAEKPDTKELVNAVNTYNSYKSADYTAETWKVFADALDTARKLMEREDVTQEEVNQALTALQTAQKNLVKVTLNPEPGNPEPGNPEPENPSPVDTVKVGDIRTSGNLKYKVTASNEKTKTVTVMGGKRKNYTKITIPATVTISRQTYKVTAVSDKAFFKNTKLKTVVLGKNIVKIGKNAFNSCKKLKSITIKSTKIKSIGKNAFQKISNSAKIKVPKRKLADYRKYLKKSKLSSKVKVQ